MTIDAPTVKGDGSAPPPLPKEVVLKPLTRGRTPTEDAAEKARKEMEAFDEGGWEEISEERDSDSDSSSSDEEEQEERPSKSKAGTNASASVATASRKASVEIDLDNIDWDCEGFYDEDGEWVAGYYEERGHWLTWDEDTQGYYWDDGSWAHGDGEAVDWAAADKN